MPDFKFRQLIDEPLGPYRDSAILDSSFPSPGILPTLECLTLECGNKWIGLDDTEFVAPPLETHFTCRNTVYFYGTLRIESLDWLSPEGLTRLENELRHRDQDLHPHLRETGSSLTLQNVYGDAKGRGSTISVIIQCEKSMLVEYMTSDRYKDSFIIQSAASHGQNQHRKYQVISMDGAAFGKSQNFIMRYRLWALIKKIIEVDGNETPIHKRTVRWLVERSLEKLRLDDPEFRDLAARYNEEEEDAESSSSSSEDEGEGVNRPYRPRHISLSEVKGIYASQAEWILAQQLAPQHKNHWKVNMVEWVKFCHDIQVARKEAARHGVRWGLPFGVTQMRDNVPLAVRLVQHGRDEKFWESKLQNLPASWSKVEKKVAAQVESDEEDASRLSPEVPLVEFQYDSDFSEPSTPSYSDSDGEEQSDPALVARVPRFCWRPPSIPSGRFVWGCPGCNHHIDLLDLHDEDLEPLPRELRQHMVNKEWKSIEDGEVQRAFALMANQHYIWHMHRKGVRSEQRGKRWIVVPHEA